MEILINKYNNILKLLLFLFKKILLDTCPFLGATDTSVFGFWWRLFWVSMPDSAALSTSGRYASYLNSPLIVVKHVVQTRFPWVSLRPGLQTVQPEYPHPGVPRSGDGCSPASAVEPVADPVPVIHSRQWRIQSQSYSAGSRGSSPSHTVQGVMDPVAVIQCRQWWIQSHLCSGGSGGSSLSHTV